MQLRYALIVLTGLLCTSCPADPIDICLEATNTSAKELTIAVSEGDSCSGTLEVRGFSVWQGDHEKIIWASDPENFNKIELSSITYGQLPEGFTALGKAQPIQPGDEILFEVSGPLSSGHSLKITVTE